MSSDPDDKVAMFLGNVRVSLGTRLSIHCFSLQLLLSAYCMPSSVLGLERQTSLCSRRFQPVWGTGTVSTVVSALLPSRALAGPPSEGWPGLLISS